MCNESGGVPQDGVQVFAAGQRHGAAAGAAHLEDAGGPVGGALRGDTLGAVGATRPRGATEILWDSIGAIQGERITQGRVVAGIGAIRRLISWDSIGPLQRRKTTAP